MILSDTSIKRPVFATVINLLIMVFGLAALNQLPVREYPDIDPPIVSVVVNYTGAAPEVIDSQIVQIIEGGVSGVDGIRTIESSSEIGEARINIEFSPDRDVDAAANDVRDAVSRVTRDLPTEADPPEIRKADSNARPMMWIALRSDQLSPAELTDYAVRNMVDRLSVLSGVAQVRIGGERRYAMRIWLDRQQMAARRVTVADVEQALRANNIELPSGTIESTNRDFTVRTDSRLADVQSFRELVIRKQGDYPLRLGDIARVELGVEDDTSRLRSDGTTAIGLGIIRQSKANTVEVSDRVQEELEHIKASLPAGISFKINYDESLFIRASIQEVITTLGFAILLVVLVIFAFLRSLRATIIPAITIPVSIIGSFIALAMLGFSLNVLTLLALILAIGLVVDDAIVMLENIQRRIETGEPPLLAAFRGARQVGFAIVATTLTLVAVFVPISFMEGNIGRLFSEFGMAMAAAVIVSSIVALTLTPMLCSQWLNAKKRKGPLENGQPDGFTADPRQSLYGRLLDKVLDIPVIVLAIGLVLSLLAIVLYNKLPQELTPTEDRASFTISATAPMGSTAAYTDHHMKKIEELLLPYLEQGVIEGTMSITGFRGDPDRGNITVKLAPWEERDWSQQSMVAELTPKLLQIPGVRAVAINPPGLGQSGFNQPLQIVVSGPDYESAQTWSEQLLRALEQNPNLIRLDTDFELTRPQIGVEIDRQRAADLGITAEDIGRTLQTMLASRTVTRYMDRGREYDVMIQAEDADRVTPSDISNIFLRSSQGELVPISSLVKLKEYGAPPELRRIDRLPSVTLSGSLAPDYDMGSAIRYIEQTAAEVLPSEARLSYKGLAREFTETSGAIYLTFVLAFVIVFLVLAAQFESWIHPAIIMLSVPLAITGALISLLLTNNSLNIYSQIGMVMLLGLMAKNGILVVEFANQLRDQGKSVREAIIEGSVLRLRPILMTTISTVFGVLPLVLTSGAGAESRTAIGVVILGGLLFATILTLFIIPVLYNLLASFARPAKAIEQKLQQLNRQPDTEQPEPTR